MEGLLELEPTGPTILSGGDFGVEASIFAVVLGVGTGVAFSVQAGWSGHFIARFCRRTACAAPEDRSSAPHGHHRAREHGAREAGDPAKAWAISTVPVRNPKTVLGSLPAYHAALLATRSETTLGDNCKATRGHTIMTEFNYAIPSPPEPPVPSPGAVGTVGRAPQERLR